MKQKSWNRKLLLGMVVLVLTIGLVFPLTQSDFASAETVELNFNTVEKHTPEVIGPFTPTVYNGDLRDLPQLEEGDGGVLPPPMVPNNKLPPAVPGFVDPVAQNWQGEAQMPEPIITFEGLNRGAWIPPDTNGDVGPQHYIQTVNIEIGIFDKASGASLVEIGYDAFFAAAPAPCNSGNRGDVISLYDHLADRWIITDFHLDSTPTHQCVAISQTGDPVGGGWWFYAIPAGNVQGSWHDYPKLSVWPTAYFMTANMFDPGAGGKVWALDRAKMLVGAPMTAQTVDLGTGYYSLLPGNLEGPVPPDGAPGYFASIEFLNTLHIWRYFVDWDVPANSHLDGPFSLQVADFGYIGGIPQPAPGSTVASLGDRLMMQLQYRNFGDHEALWVNHTVASGDVAGIRWYEVRDPAGAPYVYQQSTYQPDDTYRWMGSLAVDQDGNMALGYSISSTSLKPSIRYAGRLYGEILGTLPQAENSIIEGTGVQVGADRWGDYSAMTVDPVDDCTFWYTQEYYTTISSNWQTRIGSFKFPSCGAVKGYLGGTVYDSISSDPIPDAIVVAEGISTTLTTQADSTGYFTMTLPTDVYTLTASSVLPGYPNATVISGVDLQPGAHLVQDIPLDPFPAFIGESTLVDDNVPRGNGNGYAEPGEIEILLFETILNIGASDATNITSQLVSLTPGVTVISGESTYPDLAVGESQPNDTAFVITIAPTVTCGIAADFLSVITTDQGVFSFTVSLDIGIPQPNQVVFSDDMENGMGDWVTGGTNNFWALTTVISHTPTHSWTDSPAGQYLDNTDSWLRSPFFDLTGKRYLALDFWHQYSMETGWDFLYVEYSLDGGATWSKLNSGYTGQQLNWTQATYDLAVVDNQPDTAFRFNLKSDGGVRDDGWYIDDVSLSYIPFECEYPVDVPIAPILVSPVSGTITTTTTVTLTWEPGVGEQSDGYNLEIDGSVYTTTETIQIVTLDTGVHNWKVRAYNVWGVSEYTDAWSFEIIETPGVPTLISPVSGTITTTATVTLTWEAGTGGLAVGYNIDIDGSVYTTTETFQVVTLGAGVHNWRVRAFNISGASEYTEAWNFEIVGPGIPALISPQDSTVTSSPITFVWEGSDTGGLPTGYIFMLDGTPIITFTTPIITVTLDLSPGPHTWSVAAFNDVGQSEFADVWEINVLYKTYLPITFKN